MAVFVALIAYLVNTMNWAEHSERVIGDANEMLRLAVDRESSMRGFLITGDESFLAPYEVGATALRGRDRNLTNLVSDNPPQVERLKQIQAVQAQWDAYAQQTIDLRRRNQAYQPEMASNRGKIAIRRDAPRVRRISRCGVAPETGAHGGDTQRHDVMVGTSFSLACW